MHLLYKKILNLLREIKKNPNSHIPKDIVDRSKLFVIYALKVYFEIEGYDVNSQKFFTNFNIIDSVNLSKITQILSIIYEEVNSMLGKDKSLNKAKAFQRKELVDRIRRKMKEIMGDKEK